jgi:hypothetical protein
MPLNLSRAAQPAKEGRAKAQRATAGRAHGYRDGKIDRGEAFMVLEMFGKFADGISPRAIAAESTPKPVTCERC